MDCDVVITQIGGPKEYYNGMAKIINPYDVNGIGRAIKQLLDGETYQPYLGEYVRTHYSMHQITLQLLSAYKMVYKE